MRAAEFLEAVGSSMSVAYSTIFDTSKWYFQQDIVNNYVVEAGRTDIELAGQGFAFGFVLGPEARR
jgi:hypothetical protein